MLNSINFNFCHVLKYNLTNNASYCKNAVNNYAQVFKQYISNKEDGPEIYSVLDWTIKLSTRIKLDMSSIEETLLTYLNSIEIGDETKRWILAAIKENYAKWKPRNLEFVPQLCLDIYSHDSDYGNCKQILEIGEFFAIRLNRNLLTTIYESLGDNEERIVYAYDGKTENMVKPHYNQYTYQRMMQYYKKAGNSEKLRYATAKYNENKVGMRFLEHEKKGELPKEVVVFLNQLFKCAEETSSEDIIYFLSKHNDVFFVSHTIIEESWKRINLFTWNS